ncbi:MAG: hypothetical protein ABI678_29275 [Kofleriaceae bacterium]
MVLVAWVAACGGAPPARLSPDAPTACASIAEDLETLRPQFPALREYRGSTAERRDCYISYGWHTHRSQGGAGWAAGVPNPDPDGVWFYIGIYDPAGAEARSQINSQPMTPDWRLGSRKVTFLVLEGEQASGLGAAILDVLSHHGMRTVGG